MRENNINRSDLARRTGINVSTISRIINGKRVPDFHQAKKIADALEMPLDVLYRVLYYPHVHNPTTGNDYPVTPHEKLDHPVKKLWGRGA